jgi:hypothetical protein
MKAGVYRAELVVTTGRILYEIPQCRYPGFLQGTLTSTFVPTKIVFAYAPPTSPNPKTTR